MIGDFFKNLLGSMPHAVRYCERDGSLCDAKERAELLRARIEQRRAVIFPGL